MTPPSILDLVRGHDIASGRSSQIGPLRGEPRLKVFPVRSINWMASKASGPSGRGTSTRSAKWPMSSDGENVGGECPAAIQAAARAYEQLDGSGKHIHFEVGEQPGTLQIELHDHETDAVRPLTPTDVMRVCSGESLTK